ncbi:MAG: hypothetical protein R3F44_07060 [Candidatus Competibacteraceae bacterium]
MTTISLRLPDDSRAGTGDASSINPFLDPPGAGKFSSATRQRLLAAFAAEAALLDREKSRRWPPILRRPRIKRWSTRPFSERGEIWIGNSTQSRRRGGKVRPSLSRRIA